MHPESLGSNYLEGQPWEMSIEEVGKLGDQLGEALGLPLNKNN